MTVSVPVKKDNCGAVNFVDNNGSVSFFDCFPENVHLSSDGILLNDGESYRMGVNGIEFQSRFFHLLFKDFPVDFYRYGSDDSVFIVEPYPDIIADFMADKLIDGAKMNPSIAKAFFFNKMSTVDNFSMWEERESVFYSIFYEHIDFAEKIDFLYSSYSHHESSRKLVQFITLNELLMIHLDTGKDLFMKDVLSFEMESFSIEVYRKYHDWDFSFHDYTYKLADLIFGFDKNCKNNRDKQLELGVLNNFNIRQAALKNPIPQYISYNNLFSQVSFPGEFEIAELTTVPKNKPYRNHRVQQDNIILENLKKNNDILRNKKSRWDERSFQEDVNYSNLSLWARNMLKTMSKGLYKETVYHINTVVSVYYEECSRNRYVPLKSLGVLLSFTVYLVIESNKNGIILEDSCIIEFVYSFCSDYRLSNCGQDDIKEIVHFFVREKGEVPPIILLSTLYF